MKNINFNELAWKAPKHGEKYGYIPTDNYYSDIIEWFKSGERIWRSREGNITTTRLSIPNSKYDVIAEFDHTDKMVSWIFRESGTFII